MTVESVPVLPLTSSCAAFAAMLQMRGATISIFGQPLEGSSDAVLALEEWQYVIGEGPSIDAFSTGERVAVPHLVLATDCWPVYVEQLGSAGVGAVFSFPVRLSGHCVGSLTFYRDSPGELTDRHALDGAAAADDAARRVGVLDELDGVRGGVRFVHLHQAAGMVMFELGVDSTEALARLRGHAYATHRPLHTVVADVLGGRLRLPGDRR